MEYPNTRFSRKARLVMLIIFITAFFIISPIILMYTAGYRYDWQNGILKETGAISVDVEPKNATVYLNGIKLQDKMPIRLNNITPAKYALRITAPEYFDWEKEIEVKNKQTNYTKEISLIKKNNPEILINEKIDNYSLSSDGRFLIYTTKQETGIDVRLWDNNTRQATTLFTLNTLKKIKIVWAEKNNYVLIADADYPHSQLLIINAANPLKQIDLAKDNSAIEKFEWENSSDPQIYYSDKENIILYSPITAKSQEIAKNKYIDWHMENGQLWTLQTNSSTGQYTIVRDTLGFNSIFNFLDSTDINIADDQSETAALQILATRQNTVLLQNKINSQMILVTNANKHRIFTDKFIISKYNNWWLMWSVLELWTYSEGEEPYLLNRSGENLREVIPVDNYNSLLLAWTNKTTVLFPYYLTTHDLLNEKITNVNVDTENKILYFTKQNQEGIWKLNY